MGEREREREREREKEEEGLKSFFEEEEEEATRLDKQTHTLHTECDGKTSLASFFFPVRVRPSFCCSALR